MSRPARSEAFTAPGPIVGVTGTNGKTSTAWLIAAGLQASGRKTYVASTIDERFGSDVLPPAPTHAAMLARFHELLRRGAGAFVLECTSHALAKGFAALVRFDAAVFTNLTREHLDQHGSFEHYLASKAQLFLAAREGGHAVLNAGDPHAKFLEEVVPASVARRFYAGSERSAPKWPPHLAAARVELSASGTRVELASSVAAEALGGRLELQLVGEVFAENALAAAATLLALEVPGAIVRRAFAEMPPVPGRFELVSREPLVAVDYAHTPDALARTCATARKLAGEGRVIVVFGAGGNRDSSKRAHMGRAVARHADRAIVTNDNPRGEAPEHIAAQLLAGARAVKAPRKARLEVVLDRREAIARAIASAGRRDVVVICGKGHERGQEIGGQVEAFSDRELARELLGLGAANP